MSLTMTETNNFTVNDLNRVRRLAYRGHYDRATIYPIVDEALICHVGFVQDGQAIVIPTIHARVDDTIYLHGAPASRLLKLTAAGEKLCITCTLLDGLVLARSAFHSSMNYRSAVLFGTGRLVTDYDEQWLVMEAITEHVAKGRWADVRRATDKEMQSTKFVAVDIETASAKVRTGPPGDDEEDYALPIWAGVLPLMLTPSAPIDDPRLIAGVTAPQNVSEYRR